MYECSKNDKTGESVLRYNRDYEQDLTADKSPRLKIKADETFLMPSEAILAADMGFIQEVKSQRAKLRAAVSIRRMSRVRCIREAGDFMISV